METLSARTARRIALAAQGFDKARPATVDLSHLIRLVNRLGLHQIDSVNVLARAHYLPAFSRLGAYDPALLDAAAWGGRGERKLFEYWAHEASLIPLTLHPLLRWRMVRAERGEAGWGALRRFARDNGAEIAAILSRIRAEGALAASDFEHGRSRSGWWEWGSTKRALEWLFWTGQITTATRRGSFERVYDLPERVVPARILALPTPVEADAHRGLIDHAARALGIATAGDLRDYFRLDLTSSREAIASLVEDGDLVPVRVEGWQRDAYLHRAAKKPRQIVARALLAPFDPLIWERSRAERLFGFRYRIEIYTPAAKRTYGYYVLPFLLDDRLVARVDLKADRQNRRLIARAIHLEPDAPPETRDALHAALGEMAAWLRLDSVVAS